MQSLLFLFLSSPVHVCLHRPNLPISTVHSFLSLPLSVSLSLFIYLYNNLSTVSIYHIPIPHPSVYPFHAAWLDYRSLSPSFSPSPPVLDVLPDSLFSINSLPLSPFQSLLISISIWLYLPLSHRLVLSHTISPFLTLSLRIISLPLSPLLYLPLSPRYSFFSLCLCLSISLFYHCTL